MATDESGAIAGSVCPWDARKAFTLQQRASPCGGRPAVSGSGPHQTPLLSWQTPFDTGICVQLAPIVQGPLTAPLAWMLGPTCVKFDARMLAWLGLVR